MPKNVLEDSWCIEGEDNGSLNAGQPPEKLGDSLNGWDDEKQDNLPEPLSFTPEAQFQRDIDMITGAIDHPGANPFSAAILQKIFTLFYYGDLRYFKDGEWRSWDLPLASAIAHGARVTIQFPSDLSKEIMRWLFEDEEHPEKYVRSAATHGLKPRKQSEIQFNSSHSIREIKLSMSLAGYQAGRKVLAAIASLVSNGLSEAIDQRKRHFGINLALGGAGKLHPTSCNVIANNGEHGHFYVFYRPEMKGSTSAGLLVGIEQSAPGCPDQNGGSHGVMATHHVLSATAGEDFGKSNNLAGHGPSRYYDGIFLDLTEDQFKEIKKKPPFNRGMLGAYGDREKICKSPYLDVPPETPVIVLYNGKKLARHTKKQAGKNNSAWDGFYKDEDGNEYFIKVPSDQTELFTELFTGKILDQFKKFLPEQYHESLICADQVALPDGTYGLIQPKKNIKEIWKYFAEQPGNQPKGYVASAVKGVSDFISNPHDRNIPYETMYGQTQQYPSLAQLGDINSLAVCLLCSLMMGDYSVHSANIVYSQEEKAETLFSKIDFGAALRYIGDPKNTDIMNPPEYHGLFWFKYYTKGFHLLYKNVPGLYKAVSEQAKQLLKQCSEEELDKIVLCATEAIPKDLLEQSERYAAAAYMGIDEFKAACLGDTSADKQFSQKLAPIIFQRIQKLAALPALEMEASPVSASETPRLGPNRMFDFAFQKLERALLEPRKAPIQGEEDEEKEENEGSVEVGEEQSIEIILPSQTEDVYATRFILQEQLTDGSNIILTSPACDIEAIDASAVGTTPLPQVLKQIRELQKDKKNNTYFVPLAECWPIVPYGPPRQHWTLLMIREDRCYFVDPCPSLHAASFTYSYGPLKWGMARMLQVSGFEPPNTSYLGWQQDTVNCGRYVSAIIEEAAKLIYSATPFNKITTELEGLRLYPTAEALVHEEAECKIPEEIQSNQAVCSIRRQEGVFERFVDRRAEEEAAKARDEEARIKAEAEARAEEAKRAEAEAEAETKAKLEAEARAKAEAEARAEARAKAEAKARAEAEEERARVAEEAVKVRAREEAAARIKAETEAQAEAAARKIEEERAKAAAEKEKVKAEERDGVEETRKAKEAAEAKRIKQANTKAGAGFTIGIVLTGIGLLAKFSLLVAISITSTAGIPVILIGGVLTLGSTVYYCAVSNRKQSAPMQQDVLPDDDHQESVSSVCCGCLYRAIKIKRKPPSEQSLAAEDPHSIFSQNERLIKKGDIHNGSSPSPRIR